MRYPARPAPAHRHRGNPATWPRRLAVTVLLAMASTTVLVTGIASPAFAGSLVSPGWAVSQTAPGTPGVDYTYTFTTASTSELDSVTMTVPAGTGGLPAVGTVTPAALADGGSVTVRRSADLLVHAGDGGRGDRGVDRDHRPGEHHGGGQLHVGHRDRGCGHAGGLGDHAGGQLLRTALVSPEWAVSDAAPGAAGVDYTYSFTTASTSELDSVTMTVPAGTGGSPAVGTVTPAAMAAGGSVSLAGAR